MDWKVTGQDKWKDFVPNNVRKIWDTFTLDQQQALYFWADHLADELNANEES